MCHLSSCWSRFQFPISVDMLLSLLCFIAYLLCICGNWVDYDDIRCPRLPSRSCQCKGGYWSAEISCRGASVAQVREALTTPNWNGYYVGFVLECAELGNLRSYVPQGVNLKVIELRGCDDSFVLDEDTFAAVANRLERLNVSSNAFERVPGRALGKLIFLKDLYFNNNKLKFLHAGAFEGLQSLRVLKLQHNRIKHIDDLAFKGIGSRFWLLKLNDNQLKSVPIAAMRNLSSLEYLILNNNRITTLQPEGFAGTAFGESLEVLKLGDNKIRRLPRRAFPSLRKVFHLDLTSNKIRSIDPFAFEGMEGNELDLILDRNRLTEVPAAALRNLTSIATIHLRSNKIRKLRKDDFPPSTIGIFLQSNLITHVHPESFLGLDHLSSLGLENNQLNTLPYDTYSSVLDTMENLTVYGNPFHCDCQMSWLVEYMKGQGSDVEDIKCALPVELHNMKLEDVLEDKLTCPNAAGSESITVVQHSCK